jgi:hypothetical protein
MNPIEMYLTEKQAGGFGDFARGMGRGAANAAAGAAGGAGGFGETVGRAAASGAGQVAGGLALAGAGVAMQSAYSALTKAHDFRAMLEANPDLAEAHGENPRLFNQMFSTLRAMNPAFSKEPLVAGQYMREMTGDPLHAGSKAVSALEHRDKLRSPIMGVFSGGKKGK